ncbi:DolP-mannose mannosyltransferase [Halorarius halobius]|uniref:DolP-mannose mannosyltransferase n=1 Tax=Halorarius halobius TaxID=2962671 RepID=UPI0020CCF0DD|nr:DolP-mannose mannosyltransferase [Halorarius halobius]
MAPDTDALPALPVDREALESGYDRALTRLDDHPLAVTAVLALVLEAYAAYRVYAPLGPNEWPVLKDSVIFEYIGWHLAHGTDLYTGIWEVKPPLAFELLGVVAALSGGSVAVYHTLALALTGGAIVATSVAIAAVVHELTDDTFGAVVGGLAVFTLPSFYWRALIGFKSKYFVAALGIAVVWLALRERPRLAGVAGACCIGFWQLSFAFPLAALAVFLQRGEGAKRYVATGVAAGVAILLPVVVMGSFPAMIAEAVLTPLLSTENATFRDRVQFILRVLGRQLPVILVGLAGLGASLTDDRIRREWPLVAVAAWFTFVMVFIDFDTLPDSYVWFAVVAIGVGLAVGRGTGDSRRVLGVAVTAMVLLSVVTMGGFGTGRTDLTSPATYNTTEEMETDFLHNRTERQYLFWHAVDPPTCRVFVGQTQFRVIKKAKLSPDGEPYWQAECGQLDPIWATVVEKYT